MCLGNDQLDFNNLRTGMLFKCVNLNTDNENGITVSFAGNTGTIFKDHIIDFNDKNQSQNNNFNPKKIIARIININYSKKTICLSGKSNLVQLKYHQPEEINKKISNEEYKVNPYFKLYGDSYIIELTKNKERIRAFFHYSNFIVNGINKFKSVSQQLNEKMSKKKDTISQIEQNKEIENIDSLMKQDLEYALSQKLKIKEYNYFDNNPVLILDDGKESYTWENLKIGQVLIGEIIKIDLEKIYLKISKNISGTLSKFHLADIPLNLKNVKKYKLNQKLNVTIFDINSDTKKLVFTMKPSLLPLQNPKNIKTNMILNFVYLEKDLFMHCGGIKGKLLNFKEANKEIRFKEGYIYSLKICKIISSDKLLLSTKDEDISNNKTSNLAKIKHMIIDNVIAINSKIIGVITSIKGKYIFAYLGKNTIGKIPQYLYSDEDIDIIKKHINEDNLSLDEDLLIHCDAHEFLKNVKVKVIIKGLITVIKENYNIKFIEIIPSQSVEVLTNSKGFTSIINAIDDDKITSLKVKIIQVESTSAYPLKISYGTDKLTIPFYHLSEDLFVAGEALTNDFLEINNELNLYCKMNKRENGTSELLASLCKNKLKTKSFKIEVGNLCPIRILKAIPGKGLVVSLYFDNENHDIESTSINGFVDITEITDLIVVNPLIHFKLGSIVLARVLKYDLSLKKYFLSLRSDLVIDQNYNLLNTGTTQSALELLNKNPIDLRNKIFKFGAHNTLEQNQVLIGYVSSSSKKGVFIKVSSDLTVRAPLNEITDLKLPEPFNIINENEIVLFRIISKSDKTDKMNKSEEIKDDHSPKYTVSLRESVIKYNITMKLKDLNIKSFYLCMVIGKNKDKQLVNIIGSTFNGEIRDNSNYKNQELLVLELVNVNKETFPPSKIQFSAHNVKKDFDESIIVNPLRKDDLEKSNLLKLIWEEIDKLKKDYQSKEFSNELSEINMLLGEQDLEKNVVNVKIKNSKNSKNNVEDNKDYHSDSDYDEDINENLIFDYNQKLKLINNNEKNSSSKMNIDEICENNDDIDDEDLDEYEEENENEELDEDDEINDEFEEMSDGNEDNIIDDENEEEIEDDEKQNNVSVKKINSSNKREKNLLNEEKVIREKESKILEGKESLDSVEDYEKRILKNPNSSEMWIMYAAFILSKTKKYNLAKKVFERAVKAVDITEATEKLNIWVGYMNFEKVYGTHVEFVRIVDEAMKINDKKQIYKHLILIYKNSGNNTLIYETYKLALRTFKNDVGLWKAFIEFLFIHNKEGDNKEFQTIKETLSQALQSLIITNKKIELLIHYSSLNYKYDNLEQGKMSFESLIKEYPKRHDIILVYIDKEIQFNPEKVRNVFKKFLEKDLKIKVLKQIAQKYLQHEKQTGSKDDLEKAMKYVKEIMSNKVTSNELDQNSDNDEDEM